MRRKTDRSDLRNLGNSNTLTPEFLPVVHGRLRQNQVASLCKLRFALQTSHCAQFDSDFAQFASRRTFASRCCTARAHVRTSPVRIALQFTVQHVRTFWVRMALQYTVQHVRTFWVRMALQQALAHVLGSHGFTASTCARFGFAWLTAFTCARSCFSAGLGSYQL